MISFSSARELVASHVPVAEEINMMTKDTLGFYIAQEIYAPIDFPHFDNSAVDGFAVRAEEVFIKSSLALEHIIRAVGQEHTKISVKSCAKIMTGAPIPEGANAVIMKEDSCFHDSRVSFSRVPTVGDNIRQKGEDIKKDSLLAHVGQRVTPQLIGLLEGLGVANIIVFKKPRVFIICTGDELVEAPQELKYGEVYFLIGAMLKAQAANLGLEDIIIKRVGDSEEELLKALQQASLADLVLISGGMSKGDHDLVRPVLKKLQVREIFYEGLWRPGKPLYFGRQGQTIYFGLPGNPVACFVMFRIFVQFWLENFFKTNNFLDLKTAVIKNNFTKSSNYAFFARAFVDNNNILEILTGQGSHQIFSLSQANALCYLPEGISNFCVGQSVRYWAI